MNIFEAMQGIVVGALVAFIGLVITVYGFFLVEIQKEEDKTWVIVTGLAILGGGLILVVPARGDAECGHREHAAESGKSV